MISKFFICLLALIIAIPISEVKSDEIIIEGNMTIATGGGRNYAIKPDSSLWTWGVGWYGDEFVYNQAPFAPRKIMENVITISAGAEHTLAIQADGSLWACAYVLLSV